MKGESVVKEIQIQNLRSLKDTGIQKLAPITLLVGENSSGKSSFLRAFPLLKQSIKKKTSGPILWAGDFDDYVDFGSFEETVTNDGSNEIAFRFRFNMSGIDLRLSDIDEISQKLNSSIFIKPNAIDYKITIDKSKGVEGVSKLLLSVDSYTVEFDIRKSLLSTEHMGYRSVPQKELALMLREKRPPKFAYFRAISDTFEFALPDIDERWEELFERLHSLLDSKDLIHYFFRLIDILGIQLTKQDELKPMENIGKCTNPEFWQHYNQIVEILNNQKNSHIADLIKLCYIYTIFPLIDAYLGTYFGQVHYIAPIRASAERYYRLRNLAVDDIDYQGKNLAEFINSLTYERKKQFQKWTYNNFGFTVNTSKSKGHISLLIQSRDSSRAINLSDTGFGYSQILPIITQLWDLSSQKPESPKSKARKLIPLVVAIEQPELHLHPAVQGRLSKAFISSIQLARQNGFEMQLLLETHSETIVNYMGRAIAKGILSPSDVSIILFEKGNDLSITSIKSSHYDDTGYLTNWPYGFFETEE